MGRYYWGDIEGKFWFGVQPTTDISELISCDYDTIYTWEGCHCDIECEDELWTECDSECEENCQHMYCNNCFENKQSHIHKILEDDESYQVGDYMYREMNCIRYKIDINHLEELNSSLDKLKTKIGKDIIDEYNKLENNEKLINAGSGVFDGISERMNDIENSGNILTKEESSLIARYGLGMQIKYVLTHNKSCVVYCEY